MAAPKKHRCKFESFVSWGQYPIYEDADYWNCTVKGKCSCGKEGLREATHDEVEGFIADHTCKECGRFKPESPHTSTSHCLKEFQTRIQDLERIIDGMRSSLRQWCD